ncbi:restriction endonuclease subunit S [Variovorax sp. LjRoot130]|uniref:restriction endonuclease subunit S n=1 Tax=Variovorax sp. LjRoot130 TaxID=3342261 RepID=UPI003ECF4428
MHDLDRAATPNDWKIKKLGEVASCTLGGTPSTEVPRFWGGDIPWMASGDVNLRRVRDVPGRISEAGLTASNATLVAPPAVAIGLAGQGKTRGTVALTLCELSSNQSIALFRGDDAELQSEYLFHNLDHRYEELRARSSGGGRGGLSKGILEAVPLSLPPLREQSKIVEILDTLDAIIRQTESIIEKLRRVKQGLLHDLLTRGMDASGELRPSQKDAPHLYKESVLGWIPKGWSVQSLAAACDLIRDGTHLPPSRTETGPLLLSVRNMKDGRLLLTDQDTHVSEAFFQGMHKHWTIEVGDVLLAIVGATIGKLAVVGDLPKFTLQRSVAVLRGASQKLHNSFLYASMSHKRFQDGLWAQVNQTAQPGLYLDQLGAMQICLPPLAEQRAAIECMSTIEVRLDCEIAFAEKLRRQKFGLMDDLLTGRVRVTPLLA